MPGRTAVPSIVALLCACVPADPAPPSHEDYGAADALFEPNLVGSVKNQSVEPHWIGDDGAFWYRRDTADGHEYVRFDATGSERTALFDHEALAGAVEMALAARAEAAGVDSLAVVPTASDLGLSDVRYIADTETLEGVSEALGSAGPTRVTCELRGMSCEAHDVEAPEPGLLPDPGGSRVAFRRADDLFVRDASTGRERRLTTDGAPSYSYGAVPENSLTAIPSRKTGTVLPPSGVWSPEGRYLITARLDETGLDANPFVEWVPQDGSRRPIHHPIRTELPGDRNRLRADTYVFEPDAGRQTALRLPEPFAESGGSVLGWSTERSQAFVLARTFGWKDAGLFRVDLGTGAATPVITESADTRFETQTMLYNTPNVRVVGDGAEVIWYSDRTGWGHLYLYDGQTGDLENAITGGDWAVIDVLAVDESAREVYFTAAGREEGRDPYHRHLYKADLDGDGVRLLTDVDADHDFAPVPALAPANPDPARPINLEAGVFLDTYSTVSEPPVTVLRSIRDGSLIAEIERADATALYEAGWRAPIRERVKAADGETDLYANYYPPGREIGAAKHPVVDAVYGGPQVFVTPRNFVEAYSVGNPRYESSLARLGFAVVTVDGRGTPGRSSAFRDAGYPEFTQVGIDDHIAAIRQLAERHPEMDVDNVGIYGWSWGGTFSAQAILSRPEFYKVSVTGAGAYDYAALYSGFEPFTGLPVYEDGTRWRSEADEKPVSWEPLDVTAMAGNLVGDMLVIYGDLDENVPPTQAFRLIDALTKADRRYDLLYLANRTHAGGYDPYTVHRTWDYFVEHLMGVTPPGGISPVDGEDDR
ncbi:MAG: S9 family peptidase [Gemmatimonadota bacterium]|nr:S9 family peptidase [Gemmatimonadota bacterium]